ncbi:hypothetical protein AcV5_007972 [Taiwanofungus camphoratus]|nr:hypothetical protein AcW2_007607 [Antrodia cinnamomea]KAI0927429.1 hypothetical protein AcV5_007972 [Antrodia cinnamomea]
MGNHHLEYGFPSTHSTNSVSIALYFFTLLQRLYATPVSAYPSISAAFAASANLTLTAADRATQALADGGVQETIISATTYRVLVGLLLFYVFSIVYGRLYTGMHSFTDCIMGVTLGTSIWAVYMACGGWLHAWIRDSGWVVPAVTIPVCLLLVHKHPQPVDDCPCFEDAIAFMSVVMGEILIRWFMLHHGFHDDHFFVKAMPGSDWADWVDVTTWMLMAVVKMVVGIFIVFVWRILAKALSHLVLPPIFRLLSHLFTLPHRRFYTPATDYKSVPHDKGLHPIPSVIDLPSMMELEMDGGGASGSSLGVGGYDYGGAAGLVGMKQRNGRGREKGAGGQPSDEKERVIGLGLSVEESGGRVDVVVKHYDADVLTKVFVYCGIGILACGVIPIMFELLGWGVRAN